MQTENSTSAKKSKLMLEALRELGHQGDFGFLKNHVLLMYQCAQAHSELDHNETRIELFASFRLLYNFFVKMELYNDPEVKHINTLHHGYED